MDEELNGPKIGRFGRVGSFVIFIAVILLLSLFMKKTETVSISIGDDDMVVEAVSGFSTQILWDEVTAVETRDALELGTLVEGTDEGDEQSGTWENDEFGTYTLCTDATISCYLVFYTQSGVVVINFESAETTQSLCEAIVQDIL